MRRRAQLVPFFVGPLHESEHAVRTYWTYFAAIPGFPAPAAKLLLVVVFVASAFNSCGVSHAMRM